MGGESKKQKERPVEVGLECLTCRTRESVKIFSEDFKVLSASWRIERLCPACKETTEWTFGEAEVGADEQLDFWDWLRTTGEVFAPAEAQRPEERRKDRRVDLRVPMVVSAGGVEDQVSTENVSKSGVAFWSSRDYRLGETIRLTLESPGAGHRQTKTAVIVRVGLPADGKILYGARVT